MHFGFFPLQLTRMSRCLHPTAVNLIQQKSLSSRRASIQHLCRNMCVFHYVHVHACVSLIPISLLRHVSRANNYQRATKKRVIHGCGNLSVPAPPTLICPAHLQLCPLMPPAHVAGGGGGDYGRKPPLSILTYHTQIEGKKKKSRFTNTSCRHTFIISSRSIRPVRPRADPSPSGPARD